MHEKSCLIPILNIGEYKDIAKLSHLPHDLALWLTLSGSHYPCPEQISMVTKMFESLKFDFSIKFWCNSFFCFPAVSKLQSLKCVVGIVNVLKFPTLHSKPFWPKFRPITLLWRSGLVCFGIAVGYISSIFDKVISPWHNNSGVLSFHIFIIYLLLFLFFFHKDYSISLNFGMPLFLTILGPVVQI